MGIDITAETPTPVDYELARPVDLVVTLGQEALLDPLPGPVIETWTPTKRREARPHQAQEVVDLVHLLVFDERAHQAGAMSEEHIFSSVRHERPVTFGLADIVPGLGSTHR